MNNEIVIIKSADAGTWLREKFTPSGIVRMFGEGFVSEYSEKMSDLREIDDQIEIWAKDLGVYLDRMENSFRAKRVEEFVAIITVINNSLKKISTQKEKVSIISEEALQDFEKERIYEDPSLLSQLKNFFHEPSDEYQLSDEDLRKELVKFFKGSSGTIQASAFEDFYSQLIKEAGWLDDWKREWVYKRLQSKKRKERDADLRKLFSTTKNIVSKVITLCKDLKSARAYGKIGEYLDKLRKISDLQQEFEKLFGSIINKHFKYLSQIQSSPEKALPASVIENLKKMEEDRIKLKEESRKILLDFKALSQDEKKSAKGEALYRKYKEIEKKLENSLQSSEILKEFGAYTAPADSAPPTTPPPSTTPSAPSAPSAPAASGDGTSGQEERPISELIPSSEDFSKLILDEKKQWRKKLNSKRLSLSSLLSQTNQGLQDPNLSAEDKEKLTKQKQNLEDEINFIKTTIAGWDVLIAQQDGSEGEDGSASLPSDGSEPMTKEEIENKIKSLRDEGADIIRRLGDFNLSDAQVTELKERQLAIAEETVSLQDKLDVLSTNANNHFNFIKKLASCKNQYDAAQLLLKYSEQIENHDLNASMKLLALAEGILDA